MPCQLGVRSYEGLVRAAFESSTVTSAMTMVENIGIALLPASSAECKALQGNRSGRDL